MAVTDRQICHLAVKLDVQARGLHQRIKLDTNQVIGAAQQPMGFGPQHDVFQGAKRLHQHEMLVHHANAQCDGVVSIADVDGFAKHLNLPLIRLVKPIQDRHQGAFASAVFTHNAVHGARCHVQVHPVIGLNCAKVLADATHAHSGRGQVKHGRWASERPRQS